MNISAEVSVYPLRQPKLSPMIEVALAAFRTQGLEVRPGSMSTLIVGDDSEVFAGLQKAWQQAAASGELVMHVTLSNACPVICEAQDHG